MLHNCQMKVVSGEIVVPGRVAYVPQHPWIINDSLRENILLGSDFDQDRSDIIKNVLVCWKWFCRIITNEQVFWVLFDHLISKIASLTPSYTIHCYLWLPVNCSRDVSLSSNTAILDPNGSNVFAAEEVTMGLVVSYQYLRVFYDTKL